jgi:DNA helicase TIP49 (TBP-interacting protein)
MRAYVKSVTETNIVLVDVDAGVKFTVPVSAWQKLFGEVKVSEGDVLQIRLERLDDLAESFKRWEVVRQA